MKILVEPLAARSLSPYFQQLSALIERGEGCTEALVFDADASGIPAPMSLLFDRDSRFLAGIRHGDTIPTQVKNSLRSLADRPRPYAAQGIAYLPVLPRAGSSSLAAATSGKRSRLWQPIWSSMSGSSMTGLSSPASSVFQGAAASQWTDRPRPAGPRNHQQHICLIVTRGHSHDQEALFHLADRGARYVGLIGSQRKIKMIFENLAAEGVLPDALSKVYAPLGIDIGSQTVPEIAVSICAELIAHRNLGQVPGGQSRTTSSRQSTS